MGLYRNIKASEVGLNWGDLPTGEKNEDGTPKRKFVESRHIMPGATFSAEAAEIPAGFLGRYIVEDSSPLKAALPDDLPPPPPPPTDVPLPDGTAQEQAESVSSPRRGRRG